MLSSVLRIGEMKRKPKSFDYEAFYIDLIKIIDEYMEKENSK